ncbi:hypothetical protein BKA57DRAFT_515490 [Linnemannia elongata]|nr:hypothetical protein BKA57DRAFT_515490 [Linnemannia elongata]
MRFPKILQSDNGTEFANQVSYALLKIMEVDHRLTTPYHPRVNAPFNCRVTRIHNSTPFSLFYGRSLPGLTDFSSAESHLLNEKQAVKQLEYLTNLVYPAISEKAKATQQKMISAFNKAHRLVEFPTGSYVIVKDPLASTPLEPKYDDPYKVVRRMPRGPLPQLCP